MELNQAGREGVGGRTELAVQGMNCGGCVRHVTDALQAVEGVAAVVVSLETGRAAVRWQPGALMDDGRLAAAATQAGYPANVVPALAAENREESGHRAGRWQAGLVVGVLLTAALMAGEWIPGLSNQLWYPWAALVLASLVQFGPGRQFYHGAWNQLKVGASNMDTLVALGSTTAYLYSCWVMFFSPGEHLYFMEAAAIITLISVGHWTEARVSARATRSLRSLLDLTPAIAVVRRPDGQETEVPVAELLPGDVALLKPGARVPTDGDVIDGRSAVDESMLTGESLPVDKSPGARVYAGTMNINGRLTMRVTSVGEETALAHIIAAVQRAQNSRAQIQRLGDRVSSVFVPIVVLVALATGLWWGLWPNQAHAISERVGTYLWQSHSHANPAAAAIITAAAVLIIACPCAMGLATPAAIMAGANAAARRGILIRDGVALEKAGTIAAVLLDKTGTLTAGRPSVAQVQPWNGASEPDVVRLASSVARHSGHPLSAAVATLSDGRAPVPLASWEERRGEGLIATLAAEPGADQPCPSVPARGDLRLGSLPWLRASGVDCGAVASDADDWAARGGATLGLSRGNTLLATFRLMDALKPGAKTVVDRLRHHGLQVHLVTGDRLAPAQAMAREVGIREQDVFAEVRPEDKADLVRRLQGQGVRVAFVGDGINDAPALEAADLGVAVSRASDVARDAADIVLLQSGIEAVPESLAIARATLRIIKQNLFWAFFYNALGIPLAALGLMSPVLCAAAMGFSDLIVIGNALRLLRWKARA